LNGDLALVFDMDGVIVDSNPAHRECWEVFNRQFGLETTESMHEFMYGRRNDDIVRDFYPGLSASEIAARGAAKEALYRQMIGGRVREMLVPGVVEFVGRHGCAPKALASNAERANIELVLDRAGLHGSFRVVVDGSQVRNPKPDPEIYLRAAELLGALPGNCVVFEDSHSGVTAARAAGMRVVGISTTHSELPGTDLTVDDFRSEDLEVWLGAQRTRY
jgi:beta-phosphoglucomutase family hydrolase